jgi:hypothetical protein
MIVLPERPRNHCERMGVYTDDNKPLSPCPPELDPKWRFFWRLGKVPTVTQFPTLNLEPVVPADFPEWTSTMNMWGYKMLDCLTVFVSLECHVSLLLHDPHDSLN